MLQKCLNGLHLVWLAALLYLWHTKGRYHFNYDTMAVSLTMLEVTLVVGGLVSFGYFKFIAEVRSERVAKEVAEREAKLEARRAAEEYLYTQLGNGDAGNFADSLDEGSEEANGSR